MQTKENMMKAVNKGGRPRKNNVKICLSVDAKASEILNELAISTGKSKSKIFEEAIKMIKEKEDIIYARAKNYEKYGKEALMDFDEYMKNRRASKQDQEVDNVDKKAV